MKEKPSLVFQNASLPNAIFIYLNCCFFCSLILYFTVAVKYVLTIFSPEVLFQKQSRMTRSTFKIREKQLFVTLYLWRVGQRRNGSAFLIWNCEHFVFGTIDLGILSLRFFSQNIFTHIFCLIIIWSSSCILLKSNTFHLNAVEIKWSEPNKVLN